ncbi:MAG: di/tricarboxylate transporter [Halieaceae bacterium]|jgi:di/tricarboxylate transporter
MPFEAALLLSLLLALAIVIGMDLIRADVAAMAALLGLAVLQKVPGVTPFIDTAHLFDGFSSGAVIALIGVMIIGEALVRCGFINAVSDGLLALAKGNPTRLGVGLFTAVTAFSTVIQNAGATAMAVPIVSRVAGKMGLESRELLMPVGRMILLGGSCTLIGNSPLLLLNDLLPANIEGFTLLAPLGVGMALVVTGLLYTSFQFRRSMELSTAVGPRRDVQLRSRYQLDEATRCYRWTEHDITTVKDFEDHFNLSVVGTYSDQLQLSPTRNASLPPLGYLALLGPRENLAAFETSTGAKQTTECVVLRHALSADYSGLVEVVLTPGSSLVNQQIRDLRLRHHYGLNPLAIYRADGLIEGDIRAQSLQAGDTILAHIAWEDAELLPATDDFVVLAPDMPESQVATGLGLRTLAVLVSAVAFGLWAHPGVPFIMFAAAVALIAVGVLDPERAYRAVSWRTIFMVACLMPFSQAISSSGASAWLADGLMSLLGQDVNGIAVLLLFAVLSAIFGQLVSNIAAVLILVPVAIQVCALGNFEVQGLVLLVGISVSNAFLIPTNQVTALIASAGGYTSRDFLRTGAPISLLFCVVSVTMIALMYPSFR